MLFGLVISLMALITIYKLNLRESFEAFFYNNVISSLNNAVITLYLSDTIVSLY